MAHDVDSNAYRPCPIKGGPGPSKFHRTRCMDANGNPLCEAHGGSPHEGFSNVNLRRGQHNVRESIDHLAAFGNASALSTIEKLHGMDVAEKVFNKISRDQAVLDLLQHADWTEHSRGDKYSKLDQDHDLNKNYIRCSDLHRTR